MLKPSLQLRVGQQLTMTPQLQQAIRLLQLSTLELNQEIDQALQDNPLLEREDASEGPAFAPPGDALSATQQQPPAEETARGADERDDGTELSWGSESPGSHGVPRDPEDDVDAGDIQAAATGLREHLNAQVALTQLPERERHVVIFEVVETIGDVGQ